ncbi:interleukin-5 receptor subunit alpha isoform 2-T3 [Molossus nigricans]
MAPTPLLILLGTTVILQADSLPEKLLLLPPVNFTMKVAGLAQVLLRWEPNPDQQQDRNIKLGYHVKIRALEDDDYETKNTHSKRMIALHRGVSASVRTIPWEDGSLPASSWVSAELSPPAGSPGTSAVNLTCATNTVASNLTLSKPYQVSLHCTWVAGQEAPEDTQYVLSYRYDIHTEECQEYSQDSLSRNTACWFPRTFIDGKGRDMLAVRVSGRSQRAAIRPHDQLFALYAIDRVNPPGDVTAEIDGTHLSVRWGKPVSAFPAHCFKYEVKIHGTRNGYCQRETMTTNEYNSTVSDASKYCIEVRAAVSSGCRQDGPWSAWSQPVYAGSDEQKPSTEWILLLLMATICLFVLSLTCRTCHVWTKLFPPIPTPKRNIQVFIATINYEGCPHQPRFSDARSSAPWCEEPEGRQMISPPTRVLGPFTPVRGRGGPARRPTQGCPVVRQLCGVGGGREEKITFPGNRLDIFVKNQSTCM